MSKDWLLDRLQDSPSPLRERLEVHVARLDDESDLSGALVAAACELLDSIRDRLDQREAAYDLLAADGLLTLACEAAAFADPETLADRCRGMGPDGELGRVAERWVRRSGG
jgi:hypothetical protein